MITRKEALDTLLVIDSRKDSLGDISVRTPISDTLAREWSYRNINDSEKGKKIKRWAMENGKKCPGTTCHHKPFKDIPLSSAIFNTLT